MKHARSYREQGKELYGLQKEKHIVWIKFWIPLHTAVLFLLDNVYTRFYV